MNFIKISRSYVFLENHCSATGFFFKLPFFTILIYFKAHKYNKYIIRCFGEIIFGDINEFAHLVNCEKCVKCSLVDQVTERKARITLNLICKQEKL